MCNFLTHVLGDYIYIDMGSVAKSGHIDLIGDSLKELMSISFPKNSSKYYPIAVGVAQGAKKYQEIMVNKKPVHLCVFENSQADASRAATLLEYIRNWTGTQVFIRGKYFDDLFLIREVLSCYMDSFCCNDWRAHCFVIRDDLETDRSAVTMKSWVGLGIDGPELKNPPKKSKNQYVFPCKFLEDRFYYQPKHPSSLEDQLQACAVENVCHWCPRFDTGNVSRIYLNRDAVSY